MNRVLVASNSPYAEKLGFSRAVRVGNIISIGGTAPIDDNGKTVGLNDAAIQTRQCIQTIKQALEAAGATLNDVTRMRILLTDINCWQDVAPVRAEYFKEIKPVDTVMEVSRFINPEWLIEIEVDAVVTC